MLELDQERRVMSNAAFTTAGPAGEISADGTFIESGRRALVQPDAGSIAHLWRTYLIVWKEAREAAGAVSVGLARLKDAC
ncbi:MULTISPECIES: hypothetical protein [unclassified Variovorax]|uniref:hypothetical protein n=1 Tax=unclassified Variovorax TaxID=663243 RepID=UPI003ECC77F8